MTVKKTIHPGLVRAYREAIYIVSGVEDAISLTVGRVNHELASLMSSHGVSTAAILTAYNPYSEVLSLEKNEEAQSLLRKKLSSISKVCINAMGTDAKGEWDPEPSILSLGISLQNAEILADEYGQNAFIWINNADGFVSLRLRFEIGRASIEEIDGWIKNLPNDLKSNAEALSHAEQSLVMSVPGSEQAHWLKPNQWDLNETWPLATPDGTAMGVGTELDRMFKLIAAGVQRIY
jgi:hypothetical protein